MNSQVQTKLFSPYKLGAVYLGASRCNASIDASSRRCDDSPSDMMVTHYRQRASNGGLIIIEAASVSNKGIGYQGSPGIYDDRHIPGFKKIADAIHAKGGKHVTVPANTIWTTSSDPVLLKAATTFIMDGLAKKVLKPVID